MSGGSDVDARRRGPAAPSEAALLEAWVASRLEGGRSLPMEERTLVFVPPAPLAPQGHAPPRLERGRADAGTLDATALFDARPLGDQLPFVKSPAGTSHESERLEAWVRARLGSLEAGRYAHGPAADREALVGRAHAASLTLAAPEPSAPLTARAPSPVALRASEGASTRESSPNAAVSHEAWEPFAPIPLELYARVKVELWQRRDPLEDVLERHGLDELQWRAHERWLKRAMGADAEGRAVGRALALAGALRRARAEVRGGGAPASDPSALEAELLRYARNRAALEPAEEHEEDDVLAREGLTRLEWDDLRIAWSVRLRADPELSRRVRKAIAKARRAVAVAGDGTALGQ
jgi:hypothetical protein